MNTASNEDFNDKKNNRQTISNNNLSDVSQI